MKIMRVKQQDGTLVDIPIGVDTASSAVSAHNTNTSAHADIREQINQLFSEKVDIEMLFDMSASNYADMSTLKDGMLHMDGNIHTGSSYANYCYLESYIPVTAGEVLSIQYTVSGTRYWNVNKQHDYSFFARVAAYDSNKNIISSSGAQSLAGSYVYTYTVPDGISFVRVTLRKGCLTPLPILQFLRTHRLLLTMWNMDNQQFLQ